ncbi:MAG: tetrahydromethanopterin S-methyltransferase, subunit B [Methanobacterium sp. Maddingley MBC34]|uniref:tetrahydromethanopterin S-methyltransferase subunit MtrB n=1 Tax=Methanobacterium sp. TaxID=2164 RepID=UPI0002981674|nr:tetrahydromethanopterin S-methyltransferase subunit B [Methanobacterium sp.]EKQ53866.1 MAG: tetrahydromethanopterin S-methyltransferase, subunit B [Methanobacterium sp. Maddingley MBC34]MBI4813105.1 tetrahydromethanopterin S-methyltransferase subunit B [Methanobacterium sp.]MBI5459657.1 tetrahydromethanopterin S-methyltransferase subunit B [Methanobacterium sp.]MDY9924571.1 tetrahydromethanopterin S-methyltransferase subunit B [Methanobacterium sp.]
MEMLPLVKVVPEMNLTLDPTTGMIGAALGRDVVIVSMDGVNQQLDELEVAVEDLYTALDPTTVSEGSYPGREGTYMMAGTLTNLVYGFVLGLVLLLALLL